MFLHDFTFKDPEEVLAKLTGGSGMAHGGHGGHAGHGVAASGGAPMDLNDIEYDAYLANDRTLDDPQVVRVERGALPDADRHPPVPLGAPREVVAPAQPVKACRGALLHTTVISESRPYVLYSRIALKVVQ